MAILVVDACALAALLFGEPEGALVADRIGDRALHAPTLLRYEMANIYLKKARRHPMQREKLLAAYAMIDSLGIEYRDVSMTETITLAERFSLSAYDASYLWLTANLDGELVTLDTRLAAAAND